MIPPQYTCNGLNINPELMIEELPANTKVSLLCDDSDAPSGCHCHWLVWDILPETIIQEGSRHGQKFYGTNKYIGPCPPSGIHQYHFKVYAWTLN
jgi:Raf kinase inhibitor-like YbhB/YbcL family protein